MLRFFIIIIIIFKLALLCVNLIIIHASIFFFVEFNVYGFSLELVKICTFSGARD